MNTTHLPLFFAAADDHVFHHAMHGKDAAQFFWRVVTYARVPDHFQCTAKLRLGRFVRLQFFFVEVK
jgi:hypothetical protein